MLSSIGVRHLGAVFLLASLVVSSGCDALVRQPRGAAPTAQEPADFSSVRLPGVSVATARPVAMQVLTERYRLDTTVSTGTVLVSRPLDTAERGDAERAGVRERLSGASGRRRQIAQIHLVDRGPDVLVRCHVQVQRLDVAERGAFVPQRAPDDRPGNLPAEQHSATRTLAEEDWVNVGRDRQLERAMLNQIADRLAPVTTGTPAETPIQ
jgi:hypothetical protein